MAGTDEQTLETNVPQQGAQGTNTSVATNTDANYADYLKVQGEKLDTFNSTESTAGLYLNTDLSVLDLASDDESTLMNKECHMKIDVYIVPKALRGSDIFNPKNSIKLPYSKVVKSITFEDTLDSIGLRGDMEIKNVGGVYDIVFEHHMLYYLVVNISQYIDVQKTQFIKYEPYIFSIDSVKTISKGFKNDKVLKIYFTDIFTAILKSHSISSFIKLSGNNVTKATTYKEVFKKIVDYVKKYIKVNYDNTIELKKDVLYDENVMYRGKEKLNGYDADIDLSKLVEASFAKINRNASIWEGLQVLLRDCVTSIKLSDEIKNSFEQIGDVLIPFFFKEEYADVHAVYPNLWRQADEYIEVSGGDTEDESETSSATVTSSQEEQKLETVNESNAEQPKSQTQGKSSSDGSKNAAHTSTKKALSEKLQLFLPNHYGSISLILRQITMRDFFMPFYLCFSNGDSEVVYEDINGDGGVMTLNGAGSDNLKSLQYYAVDRSDIDKKWKNAIFLSTKGSSSECTLIFFDWFYRFFLRVFLNSSALGGKRNYISNVMPDFYSFSKRYGVGQAKNSSDKTFDNVFDEYNSYTVALTTEDTTNEALREMGKNLTSLVLENDFYSFSMKGNMLRHPNEIMRLKLQGSNRDTETQLPVATNPSMTSFVFVYVTKVVHVFSGENYTNNIIASKVCQPL